MAGIGGEQYDRFSGPDFTPNKDRRMAEWRKKKDAEKKADLEKKAEEETAREAAKEPDDSTPPKKIVAVPFSDGDGELKKAMENHIPGGELKKEPRRKTPKILHPDLFGEVKY